jgi:hypothetical protein
VSHSFLIGERELKAAGPNKHGRHTGVIRGQARRLPNEAPAEPR